LVRTISAKEARSEFSDLLGSVYYAKEAVIVEKQGRPVAVVISPEDYEWLLRQKQAQFAVLDGIRSRNPTLTAEEAAADATREIQSAREERRASPPKIPHG
jgi:prevent-host-death family protein